MRILKIWDADYPWDVRVEKILNTLASEGHDVSVVCRNLNQSKRYETINRVHFFRLPYLRNKKLNYFVSFPFFFNIFWLYHIYKVSLSFKPDAILVRDLPMALAGILIGKTLNLKIVLDMAENYPAMLQDSRDYGKFKWLNFLVRNIKLAKFVENISLKFLDKIIVVAEENKKRLICKGFCPQNILVVKNTPVLGYVNNVIDDLPVERKTFFNNKFTLLYVGGIGPIRGLEIVLESFPILIKKIPNIHFLIIGIGEKKKSLLSLSKQIGIEEYVTFAGWVDSNRIPQFIRISKLGIIPHRSTEHTNTTIPNKIFDYMAYDLPVIASDINPLKRIITKEECGYIFKSGNVVSFADTVIEAYNKKDIPKKGNSAVLSKYNWKTETTELLKIFKY